LRHVIVIFSIVDYNSLRIMFVYISGSASVLLTSSYFSGARSDNILGAQKYVCTTSHYCASAFKGVQGALDKVFSTIVCTLCLTPP